MQHADAKFERRDPWPAVPFACDNDVPTLAEVVTWIFLGGLFLTFCYLFLGL